MGWFPPVGITTLVEAVGMVPPHQLEAVPQSVLVPPSQVPAVQDEPPTVTIPVLAVKYVVLM